MSIRSIVAADRERRIRNLANDGASSAWYYNADKQVEGADGSTIQVSRKFDFTADRMGAAATAHVQPPFPPEGCPYAGSDITHRYSSPDFLTITAVRGFFADVSSAHEAYVETLVTPTTPTGGPESA